MVFTYSEKLGLCHYTQGEGEEKHIIISNTPPSAGAGKNKPSKSGRTSRAGSVNDLNVTLKEEVPQRRPRRASCPDIMAGVQRKPVVQSQTSGTMQRIALGPEEGKIGFTLRRSNSKVN